MLLNVSPDVWIAFAVVMVIAFMTGGRLKGSGKLGWVWAAAFCWLMLRVWYEGTKAGAW